MNGDEYILIVYDDYCVFYGSYKYLKLLSMFDYNDDKRSYSIPYSTADMLINSNMSQKQFMETVKNINLLNHQGERTVGINLTKRMIDGVILSKAVDKYLKHKAPGVIIVYRDENFKITIHYSE